ncbi:MAG TPA: hypothetical protein VM510_13355 [Caulifigura sp.]|nr:hypothetical protein [Caulifigura sp.]
MKNLLFVVLVVFVASIALSQPPAPKAPATEQNARPQRKPENYQKCEYKVLELGRDDAATIEKTLNAAAKEGFELERVVGDRIGIMRRDFRSERMDRNMFVQPGPMG